MRIEWEYEGKKFVLDTKAPYDEVVENWSAITETYGPEAAEELEELIRKLLDFETRKLPKRATVAVDVDFRPYWFIWFVRGVTLPFICQAVDDEEEALQRFEDYKRTIITGEGVTLTLMKVLKAAEFRAEGGD
ncbi:hypothetical protein DRO54_07020 [Candidatus Bathyarchaeota archaeon]|nr:MAG: hypothetical protein DRO54_07020 [Candidatus Bathyarchaeota archaeon]